MTKWTTIKKTVKIKFFIVFNFNRFLTEIFKNILII